MKTPKPKNIVRVSIEMTVELDPKYKGIELSRVIANGARMAFRNNNRSFESIEATPESTGEKQQLVPSKVYVLFHETNSGAYDESDGYVEAIYGSFELAEAARIAAFMKAVAEGDSVWIDPDDEAVIACCPGAEIEADEWSHCWVVREETVIGGAK